MCKFCNLYSECDRSFDLKTSGNAIVHTWEFYALQKLRMFRHPFPILETKK